MSQPVRRCSPEEVEVLFFYVWERLQGGLVQPAALNHHLHQVTDADGRDQPAFVSSHVQHRLSNKGSGKSIMRCVHAVSRARVRNSGSCGTWQMRMALSSTVLVSVV